jgi:acyl dehydratase
VTERLEDLERGAYVVARPVPIAKRIVRPPLTWDNVEVGQEFDALEYAVDQAAATRYADLVDDQHRWYLAPSLPGGPYAPPTMCDNDVLHGVGTRYARAGRLQAKQEFEFLNPLPLGSRVRSRARVVDKYRRRDRPYVVVECLTETEDGTPILRSRATLLI